jgi:cob(I)alamin adenosyltransferase
MNMSIVTKTGDSGETSLLGGDRVKKSNNLIDVYGEADELNSRVGLALAHFPNKDNFRPYEEELIWVQKKLFELGAIIACRPADREKYKLSNIEKSYCEKLESSISVMEDELPKLTSFILPGGSPLGGLLHTCRTCCRNLERKMSELSQTEPEHLPEYSLAFINRLSDYFFVLSRKVNHLDELIETTWP